MDDTYDNATLSVPTQEAVAHALPLPTLIPLELHVLSPAKRPKIKTNKLRPAKETSNIMIKERQTTTKSIKGREVFHR